MRKIIIKEGPLVFLRNVMVMELIAAILLYTMSFAADYERTYQMWGLEKYLSYHAFIMLTFSIFQVFYISLLFLDWYFSYYEITETEIIKKSGLLFRHKKSVSLSQVVSVEVYQSPIGRMMNHATIILEHDNKRITRIRNIANVDEYLYIVKQMVQSSSGRLISHDINTLLDQGEGIFVEFKETLRYDVRKGEVSKEIEKMVLKTIVAFLNADGGTLVIGVDDNAQIVGLEEDYKALPKKSRDGFENHLNMLIKTTIGLPFTKYINARFEKIDNKDICVISVKKSHKPAYLHNHNGDKKEEFFVRVGNSTQPFSISEAEEYISSHWK
jgi:membrane protein YdbS with pleckstrin-like domain